MNDKYLIKKCAVFLVFASFMVAIIAPFTFQKPDVLVKQSDAKIGTSTKVTVKKPEKPLHNVVLPNFASIRDVKEKKRQFFNFIRPAIIQENKLITQERTSVLELLEQLSLGEPLSSEEEQLLAHLSKKYRINKRFTPMQKVNELISRIDIIPSSLVLVQAANESAWGTSRFARIGLNFFGIWCYKKGCGMVPNGRNIGAKHEVAAFKSVDAAVKHYLKNINTNNAYGVFRAIRGQLREQGQPLTPQILATGLLSYSERGTDYILELTEMIRHNQAYLTVGLSD